MDQINSLESRLTTSRDENETLTEENALLSLRNKMLVEMLAVSHLDCGRALDELKTERLRVEALKWELARVSLAVRTGAKVDLSADTSVAEGDEGILVPALQQPHEQGGGEEEEAKTDDRMGVEGTGSSPAEAADEASPASGAGAVEDDA